MYRYLLSLKVRYNLDTHQNGTVTTGTQRRQ